MKNLALIISMILGCTAQAGEFKPYAGVFTGLNFCMIKELLKT